MRANPHKSAFGTIIGESAHVPTYATRHNGHPTITNHAKPSPYACHDIRNPTEPTINSPNNTPTSGNACPGTHNPTHRPNPGQTPPTIIARIRRHTQHGTSPDRPQPTTPINTNQHQSILTTNAGAISRRHQLISTTIPFGASLWNTLRYTSRRIYTLHVEALYWSFHGRTKCTYRTSM